MRRILFATFLITPLALYAEEIALSAKYDYRNLAEDGQPKSWESAPEFAVLYEQQSGLHLELTHDAEWLFALGWATELAPLTTFDLTVEYADIDSAEFELSVAHAFANNVELSAAYVVNVHARTHLSKSWEIGSAWAVRYDLTLLKPLEGDDRDWVHGNQLTVDYALSEPLTLSLQLLDGVNEDAEIEVEQQVSVALEYRLGL